MYCHLLRVRAIPTYGVYRLCNTLTRMTGTWPVKQIPLSINWEWGDPVLINVRVLTTLYIIILQLAWTSLVKRGVY